MYPVMPTLYQRCLATGQVRHQNAQYPLLRITLAGPGRKVLLQNRFSVAIFPEQIDAQHTATCTSHDGGLTPNPEQKENDVPIRIRVSGL